MVLFDQLVVEKNHRAVRGGRDPRAVANPLPEGRREMIRVARGATAVHRRFRSRIVLLLMVSVAVDAVASVLILLFERNEPGTGITNLGDSVYWTTTQLLTVSSQLPNPLSTPARVLDVFLQAFAISAVAFLYVSFGGFFVEESRRGGGGEREGTEPAL
jgi:hypothetical protein